MQVEHERGVVYVASPYTHTDKTVEHERGVVYVASPYTHTDKTVEHERGVAVSMYTASLNVKGIKAFSPIAYGEQLVKYNSKLPTDAKFWEEFNFTFLKACSNLWVLMLEGWEESKGVRDEIAFARALGIPITYIDFRN
jgi:hypothetical protein